MSYAADAADAFYITTHASWTLLIGLKAGVIVSTNQSNSMQPEMRQCRFKKDQVRRLIVSSHRCHS